MASLGGTTTGTEAIVALSRLSADGKALTTSAGSLDRIHAFLADGAPEQAQRILESARLLALRMVDAGGANPASDAIAAQVYAADVVARLAADGILDPTDTRLVAGALAEACAIPQAAASFDLFLRTSSRPVLLELPPAVAAEIQLRLLVHLEIATQVSLWRRSHDGDLECIVPVGVDPADRDTRAEARATITGRGGMHVLRRTRLRAAKVHRFGAVAGAIVVRIDRQPGHDVRAYLDVAAAAVSPLLERELLLRRSRARERALTEKCENRLTSLGLDLHDGPVQDVLALGAETKMLRDELYPFILDSHRELAFGRFDDLIARIAELDRELRQTAHSLEARSIVSRPLAEILHREVESFATRAGIEASLTVQGDPESLGAQQRIALFRAIQEALTNVREHSGASSVEVRLQMRRGSVDVRVTDDGHGFEVNRSLALAAERGRLGLVGMGERMRMLGGSFDIDSKPGGPTVVRFSLPRWEPFQPLSGDRP